MGKKKHTSHLFRWQDITNTISISMVLIVVGIVTFFWLGADRLSTYVRENIKFSIVLDDSMSDKRIHQIVADLSHKDFVKEVKLISKQEALDEQIKAMGTDPAEFLGYNPFKASLEIKLHGEYANADSLAVIEKQLNRQYKHDIDELLYQKELIDQVNHHIRIITYWLAGLALLFTLISFALINNMIRLSMYAKRFSIHTMKLVGASWGFIQRPFIQRHLLSGFIAAIITDVFLFSAGRWVIQYQPELLDLVSLKMLVIVSSVVMLSGLLITFICAYFSINRYLRMANHSLYEI